MSISNSNDKPSRLAFFIRRRLVVTVVTLVLVGIVAILALNWDSSRDPDALLEAVHSNGVDEVKDLLDHGANPNGRLVAGYIDQIRAWFAGRHLVSNPPPLFVAVSNGRDPRIIKMLLDHGANPNAGAHGHFPLHLSLMRSDMDVAEMLILKGADPNTKNREGCTALWYAAAYGNLRMAKLMLERGGDPSLKNKSGVSPLMKAVAGKHAAMVGLLKGGGSGASGNGVK